jgi:hypothetical protein
MEELFARLLRDERMLVSKEPGASKAYGRIGVSAYGRENTSLGNGSR